MAIFPNYLNLLEDGIIGENPFKPLESAITVQYEPEMFNLILQLKGGR